jgi:hypothetical protein
MHFNEKNFSEPSPRNISSQLYQLYFSTIRFNKLLDPKTLKRMFEAPQMLLDDKILKCLNAMTTSQLDTVELIVDNCASAQMTVP